MTKRNYRTAIIIFVGIIFAACTASAASFPKLKITKPDSILQFQIGQTINIEYTGGDTTKSVFISLVTVTPFRCYYVIAASAAYHAGAYQWTIPATIAAGQYKIYIESNRSGATGFHTWAYSRAITIAPPCQPTFTVVVPSGGEIYHPGDSITLRWSTACFAGPPTVNFDLAVLDSTGAGHNTFLFSGSGLPNTGSYHGVLPSGIPNGSSYIIYFTTYDPAQMFYGTFLAAMSNVFTIQH